MWSPKATLRENSFGEKNKNPKKQNNLKPQPLSPSCSFSSIKPYIHRCSIDDSFVHNLAQVSNYITKKTFAKRNKSKKKKEILKNTIRLVWTKLVITSSPFPQVLQKISRSARQGRRIKSRQSNIDRPIDLDARNRSRKAPSSFGTNRSNVRKTCSFLRQRLRGRGSLAFHATHTYDTGTAVRHAAAAAVSFV